MIDSNLASSFGSDQLYTLLAAKGALCYHRGMPTLDYLLEHSNTTIPALAAASQLEKSRVQAIVDGRWTPSPDERQAIADALGVPMDQVAFGHNMNARNIRFHRFGLKEDFNAGTDADERTAEG